MSLRTVRILLVLLLALDAALLLFGPQTRDHLPALQAAMAAKEKPEWWDDAALGIRHAAWINGGLLLVLLATSQWWARPMTKGQRSEVSGQRPKWFWPLVILAGLTSLALRAPLASKSLWWDESWVVFQVTHGKWRPDSKQPDKLKFQAHDWKRCAFYYQKPTNHVPMSLAQKASLSVWRAVTSAKREEFSDLAARAPALLASCAAVVLLALLLQSWGWSGAGVTAAFLLALHPWAIRYGADARAYALVMPLCIAGMLAVSRIWQARGATVLPWVCWGLVEFLWLWAYPNAVLDVAALNLVLAAALLRNKDTRVTGIIRLLVTNVFAAMAFVQAFLPNVMQALRWAGGENVAQPLNLHLIKSTLSHLILGVELSWSRVVETEGLIASNPGMPGTSFAGGMLMLSIAVGLLLITRHRSTEKLPLRHWILLLTPVASSLLFAALVSFTGSYFYQRFIIAALPCVIALLCVLFAEALANGRVLGSSKGWRLFSRRSLAVLLAVFLAVKVLPFWFAQIQVLVARPYAPLRDVAEYVEGLPKQGEGEAKPFIVCYGHGYEVMPVFVPRVQSALSRAELEKYVTQARSENRPLVVIQGHSVHNRAMIPDGFTLLDDWQVFEELTAFRGIEPEFYWRVFRLLPSK